MTESAKKIFEVLNLEPYEDFKINGYRDTFYMNNDLEIYVRTPRMVLKCPIILIEIINNPKSIIKLPKRTKKKLRDWTEKEYEMWVDHNCNYKCSECPFNNVVCSFKNCWICHKELYSDVFLDQEIEL